MPNKFPAMAKRLKRKPGAFRIIFYYLPALPTTTYYYHVFKGLIHYGGFTDRRSRVCLDHDVTTWTMKNAISDFHGTARKDWQS
jgi:hypothetical protein